MAAIQIRNVPEDVHTRLKAKAAAQGQSLSEYMLGEARRIAERPSFEEMVARLDELNAGHVDDPTGTDAVTALAEERAGR